MGIDAIGFLGIGIVFAWMAWSIQRERRIEREREQARRAAGEARAALGQERARELIATQIRRSDPAFDADVFESRVRSAYAAVHDGLAAGQLGAARALVSDGVFEQLSLDMEDRQKRGIARAARAWCAESVSLAHIDTGSVFDQLTVGIRARSGEAVHGEFWTFLRRHGAETRSRPGLLELRCPNCGDALPHRPELACPSCGSLLRSGEHDWVVAEITQAASWRPRAASRIPGVARLREHDPGFHPQALEDRVGVLFWRLLIAERERSGARRLRASATPEWCRDFEREQAAITQPLALVLAAEIGVRSIDVLGVREEREWIRVAVSVAWSARRRDEKDEASLRGSRLFVLRRHLHAKTSLRHAVTSSHCTGCGAPERGDAGFECAHCGVSMNDGSRAWILEETAEAGSDRAYALSQAYLTEPTTDGIADLDRLPEAAFPWTVRLLFADGPPGTRGRELLTELMTRWNLDESATNAVVAEDVAKTDFSRREARQALPILIDLALAASALSPAQRSVLLELGDIAGLTQLDVRTRIDQRLREHDGRAEAAQNAAAEHTARKDRADYRRLVDESRRIDD